MLDHSFRLTVANLSTLFLLVLALALPLHVAYGVAFREVIAVRAVADRVQELEGASAGGITADDVSSAERSYLLLNLLELALLALLVPAARTIVETSERGGIPTVVGGLRALGTIRPTMRLPAGSWGDVALAALFALGAGYLVESTLNQVVDLWTGGGSFVGVAAAQAAARAVGAPFLLVALALATRRTKVPPLPSRP